MLRLARLAVLAGLVSCMLAAGVAAQGPELRVRIDPPTVHSLPGGQFITTAQATGGSPPYRFEWFVGPERTGEVNQVRVWRFHQPGTYPVRVVATDASGRMCEATAQVVVDAPRVDVVPEGSSSVPIGGQVWYRMTPVALTPPLRYDFFLGDQPLGAPQTSPDGSPRRFYLNGTQYGQYEVRVRATDVNGVEVWGRATLAVGGAPPLAAPPPIAPPPPGPTSPPAPRPSPPPPAGGDEEL